VPGGTLGAAALGLGPLGLLVFALAKNLHEEVAGMSALVFGAGVLLVGVALYGVGRLRKR
jgi:hypothetical protein